MSVSLNACLDSRMKPTTRTHMRRAETFNSIERRLKICDTPLPSFKKLKLAVIQKPDQSIPFVVRCFRHPGNERTGFSAGPTSFDLIPKTVATKSVPRVTAVRPTQSSENVSGVWPTNLAASYSETAAVMNGATPYRFSHSGTRATRVVRNVSP